MSYHEKFKSIYLFERSVSTLSSGEISNLNLSKNSKIIFVTNFGFVEGEIILNTYDDIDLSTQDGKIVMLHQVIRKAADKVEDSLDSETNRAVAIPLKNVVITPFSGKSSNLSYFLLFADQVVGLTIDSDG